MRSAFLLCGLLFLGCTTYRMPVESLRTQLEGASISPVHVQGPMGGRYTYPANDIRTITCFDKKGRPVELRNGPSIEARLTTRDGRRRILYFDRLMLRNDTLIGSPSRFAGDLVTKIPFALIGTVEIQDGKKNFIYVEH